MTQEVEELLRSLSGRKEGRLIFRAGGMSFVKRIAMECWPGEVAGSLRYCGFEIFTRELVAVCRVWPEDRSLAISIFDDAWRIQVMIVVPGVQSPPMLEEVKAVSVSEGRLTAGAGEGCIVGWDELWPESSSVQRRGPHAADLPGQVLTVELMRAAFRFTTEFKVSVVDVDGNVVRMSDRPRTQVCYADLGLLEECNGGLWLR